MGTSRFDSSQHGQDHLIYTSAMKAALAALLLVVAAAEAGVSNRCLNTLKDGLPHDVDQASKDWILAKHNELRSKIALGKVPGHFVPKAANMEEMSWDDDLAAEDEVSPGSGVALEEEPQTWNPNSSSPWMSGTKGLKNSADSHSATTMVARGPATTARLMYQATLS